MYSIVKIECPITKKAVNKYPRLFFVQHVIVYLTKVIFIDLEKLPYSSVAI